CARSSTLRELSSFRDDGQCFQGAADTPTRRTSGDGRSASLRRSTPHGRPRFMLRWSRLAIASVPFLVACSVATPQITCTPVGSGGASGSGGSGGSGATPGSGGSVVLPEGEWTNVTNELAGLVSTCGTLYTVSANPAKDSVLASVRNQGLWESTDGGSSCSQTAALKGITGSG